MGHRIMRDDPQTRDYIGRIIARANQYGQRLADSERGTNYMDVDANRAASLKEWRNRNGYGLKVEIGANYE